MMRSSSLGLVVLAASVACSDVPIDDQRNDKRLFPPQGVIRGTVTYSGPRPCSRDGHIVGNAIVLVFDRRNPPPPTGLATSAVNFVAVPGDVLFANEPRSVSSALFCPPEDEHVVASAPFTIAPIAGGSYVLAAFYDRRGRFYPTFKFRNLPEAGDLAGGYVDTEDALAHASDPSYVPKFLPVDVGSPVAGAPANEVPDFVIGPNGFVADNVPVTIGKVVPFTRPYFHVRAVDPRTGADIDSSEAVPEPRSSPGNAKADPLAVPVLAMVRDHKILALPTTPTPQSIADYQGRFVTAKLVWGVARDEVEAATDPGLPFGLQLPELPPRGRGGLLVWSRGTGIPETDAIAALWPQVVFVKLADDPLRERDPQSLVVQGTPEETNVTGKPPGPLVVLDGITLDGDSIAASAPSLVNAAPTTAALRDHVSVLVRPAVLCFDPNRVDRRGVLVTPHLRGASANPSETGEKPLFDEATVLRRLPIVRRIVRGCLPMGRYAVAAVYPTGQAWTVPNEMGGCAPSEGVAVPDGTGATCALKPRPVLLSQGSRAVLEIIDAQDPELCEQFPLPEECQSP